MRIPAIDSHTEREPTRVVTDGLPSFGQGTVEEQARVLAERREVYRERQDEQRRDLHHCSPSDLGPKTTTAICTGHE